MLFRDRKKHESQRDCLLGGRHFSAGICTSLIEIDTRVGDKGIDNYHIDVELSAAFVFNGKEVVESVAKQVVAGSKVGRSELIDDLRSKYRDLIQATLHRAKTDLSAPLINILHFALIKFVLQETRAQMDKISEQMEETLLSRNILAQEVSWRLSSVSLGSGRTGIVSLIKSIGLFLNNCRARKLPS